jgi:hypothetical protein
MSFNNTVTNPDDSQLNSDEENDGYEDSADLYQTASVVNEDEEADDDIQDKYLKILYKDDYDGMDANDILDNDDIEIALKGIDKNIKILGDRASKFFDFDHFNEKF